MTEVQVQECVCSPDMLEEQETEREDLTLRVCRECGRRHFELEVEPGDMRAEAV